MKIRGGVEKTFFFIKGWFYQGAKGWICEWQPCF